MALRMDLTGQRYGRLVVLEVAGRTVTGKVKYLCQCECGSKKIVFAGLLRSGNTQSCGCLQKERTSAARTKHGHTRKNPKGTPEYQRWLGMKRRCLNPNDLGYAQYGGAGVTIAPEWIGPDGFSNFIDHIGLCPEGKNSIDRIDNSKGYVPGNVRWADNLTQGRNKRRVHIVEGSNLCMSEFCLYNGLELQRFRYLYSKRKVPLEIAVRNSGKLRRKGSHAI